MNGKREKKHASIVIANPIYDTVFKYLMENERVAKFFIGTLLEQTVTAVDFKSKEVSRVVRRAAGAPPVRILQIDFVATVQTEDGAFKKVLIEMQKSNHPTDIMRFREYLAGQYRRKDMADDCPEALPIITIYILGFKLPEIETACIKVDRNYIDMVNGTVIARKSPFVEGLTHDCYVVQVRRITGRYRTQLDRLLSVFEQDHFIDDTGRYKEYSHDIRADEDVRQITDVLNYCAADARIRRKMENEYQASLTLDDLVGKKDRLLEKQEKALREQEKALEEKGKALEEQARELEEKDREIVELRKLLAESGHAENPQSTS
ncbi:MAG: hypothetical protein LBT76_06770 [Tannerella sp.]|jgi:hypothetical protein|nr:hypothetical protein [Tannerella sp.]